MLSEKPYDFTVHYSAFDYINDECILYVPEGTVKGYHDIDGFAKFDTIVEI